MCNSSNHCDEVYITELRQSREFLPLTEHVVGHQVLLWKEHMKCEAEEAEGRGEADLQSFQAAQLRAAMVGVVHFN